ncbi:MAG: M28 family peptidase [Gemmatimonadales bacterium]
MKVITILVPTMLVACGAGASAEQEFDGVMALEYVVAQVGFGPRVPNTEGHRRAGDWILERLQATADSVEVQSWSHVTSDGDTLHLRNFIGHFRPESTRRVLYVAHWDTRPVADRSANLGEQRLPIPGANDGASGVALLLGVAEVLAKAPPAVGVDLLFVDGEDFGSFPNRDVLLGSTYYAEKLEPDAPKPMFAVVWDMIGDKDLLLPQEQNSIHRAPEVVRRVWAKAHELGSGRYFLSEAGNYIDDDHMPLVRAGIAAIDVIDFEYGPGNRFWHTLEDTVDKLSAESLQIVGDVAVALVR